jgi:hypothetical protein
MTKELDLRLLVGTANGPKSATWRIFTRSNDVYAAHRKQAGIEKFSFHESRICRRAFVADHPLPVGMADRVLDKWVRSDTLLAGSRTATVAFSVVFPTAHLSSAIAAPEKAALWIEPAAPKSSRVVQFVFTKDSQNELQQCVRHAYLEGEVLAYKQLPNLECFAVVQTSVPWDGRTLIVPPHLGDADDLVFPCFATPTVERPTQISLFLKSPNRSCLEYSGFKMPTGKAALLFNNPQFMNERKVIDRGTLKSTK